MNRYEKILKHSLYILLAAVGYHTLNQLLFGSVITPERISKLGWGWYALINIGAGAFLYCMGWVIREQIRDWRELRRQRSACRFPVKIFTMSDPVGMATGQLQCGKDGCEGFLARAVNPTHREGTFCLKCDRDVDEAKEFGKIAQMGARFGFLE